VGVVATIARFICPTCGKFSQSEVPVPEPNWGASDKVSEWTAEDETEIECRKCHTTYAAHASNGSSGCHITLDEYPDTEVDADSAFRSGDDGDDDDWVPDYEPPEDPYRIFTASLHQAIDLLRSHGGDGTHLINRMVFAHSIGALEAFLGDTFINEVMGDESKKKKLLQFDRDLAEEKFTLAQILADSDLVNKRTRGHLRSLMYHNIAKVQMLYRNVLGLDIFKLLGDDKDALFKAVEYRHDCVHRNGFDKDGDKLEVFTKEYVRNTADIATKLVGAIHVNLIFDDVPEAVSSVESDR
jgi:hypothetical protein